MLSFSPDEEDPPESNSAAVPYWQAGEVPPGCLYQWDIDGKSTSVLRCNKNGWRSKIHVGEQSDVVTPGRASNCRYIYIVLLPSTAYRAASRWPM